MPIFTSAVVTPTQGSLETAITAYADANSAANTVAVYANSNVILNSANLNFNNTDSISVSVTPNTVNQANIAFSVRNRLGIGTNNPSANLHVIGNTLITTDLTVAGNLFVEGNTTTLNVQTLEIEDNDIVLNANTTGSPTLNATITIDRGTSTNTFLRWNESTDRWGWSDDGTAFTPFANLVLKTGDTMTGSLNVTAGGINITAGGLAVTGGANVAGGSNISGGMVITGGSTVSGNSNFDSGTLFVDSVNDRVGVGITSPTSSLHVVGSGSFDTENVLIGSSASYGKLVLSNTSLGTSIDNTRELLRLSTTTGNADHLEFFKLRDAAGSSWDSAGWRIQQKVDSTWMSWMQFNGNGLTGGISFGTGTNTTSPRSVSEVMRINSSGNVGIGTTSPVSKLDVNGTLSLGGINFANYSGNYNRLLEPAGGIAFYLGNATDPSNYSDNTTHYFRSRGGGTTYMLINSSGNVGIANTNPGVKLDVTGTIRASSQLISTVATGTAPLAVSSTTAVVNLNADMVDGYQAATLVQTSNNSSQTTLWNPYGDYYTTVWGVGNDFNNFVNSGSYHVDNAASNHASAGSYGYLRIWRHVGSNYLLQEFTSSSTPVTTWRRLGQDNGSGTRIWTGWSKYWSDGNDGSGSGLDADLLDGLNSTDFMRSYGILDNTDQYVSFRVMRNSHSSSFNDGMYIGYGNSNSGLTRIYGGGATSGEFIKYSNYSFDPGSFRAPIFYDSSDTNYYCDPNGTSVLASVITNGQISARALQGIGSLLNASGGYGGIEVLGGGSTNAAFINFHRPGVYAAYFGIDSDNQFAIGGWSAGAALANMKVGSFGVGQAATGTAGQINATGKISSRNVLGNTNVGAGKTLSVGEMYMVSSSGQTITLPASPAAGDTVGIAVGNFTNTIVARNGQNIMGLAEDMTIDANYAGFELRFTDATNGWRIV